MSAQFNDIQMNDQTQPQQSYPSYLSIPKIRVIVRKRPLSKKELSKNDTDVVDIRNHRQVIVKELKTKVDLTKFIEEHTFKFDLAFNEQTTNEQIYIETVRPMIEAAFNKTKVTCFAYGQTGSGKTYTMMGANGLDMGTPGMYLLAAYDIFTLLQQEQYAGFSIWASFYEIYCGKLFDLLNDRNLLTAREDGKQNICIVGLTEKNVMNLNSLMQLIEYGLKARTVGVTGANSDSSRSHGIIQIIIKDNYNNQHGKISFIDLAGSERAADTIDTNKQTRIDGAEINKSLLALKECIRALDQDKKHTPFRGSKLTLVLRDSFVGNCKTLMIANISPSLGCSEHTLNTLRYADRVKELRGKPDINIGTGNVNLNYESNNVNKDNSGKDPQELLANLLMMPRQHNKTVKYAVDSNMKRISEKKVKKTKRSELNRHNSSMSCMGGNNMMFGTNNLNNNNMMMNIPMISCNNNVNMGQMNNNPNNGINMNNMSMMTMGMNNNGNNLLNMSNCSQFSTYTQNNQNTSMLNQNNLSNISINTSIAKAQINQQTPQLGYKMGQPNLSPENKENIQLNSNTQNILTNSRNSKLSQSPMENTQNPNNNNNSNGRLFTLFQQNTKNDSSTNLLNNSPQGRNSNTDNAFSFLNEYTSFTQKKQVEVQQPQPNQGEEDLNALRDKYENLVNQILTEEKDYIESHKKHIDDMVHTMKNEMNLINTVEKQANVDEYVDTLINIYSSQEEKISSMKTRLIQFKQMLKEESELSAKIARISTGNNFVPSEIMNNNCNSTVESFSNANSVINTATKMDEVIEACM